MLKILPRFGIRQRILVPRADKNARKNAQISTPPRGGADIATAHRGGRERAQQHRVVKR